MKNSFSVNIAFLVLSIIGVTLLPLLSIQLYPTSKDSKLHISYTWPEVSAEIVEKEVTSTFEGILASINGLKDIKSSSFKGYGQITLSFKNETDIDAVRFEVASLIHHAHSKLHKNVSRPIIRGKGDHGSNRELLMTYILNGKDNTLSLQKYAEEYLVTSLGLLEDIDLVKVTGANTLEWEINLKIEQLKSLGITSDDIKNGILNYLEKKELGGVKFSDIFDSQFIYVSFKGRGSEKFNWNQIIIKKLNERLIYLSDLATINLKEREPKSYFRINGQNAIYLNIYSSKNANQIKLAKQIEDHVKKIENQFHSNFSLRKSYDASEQLEREMNKVLARSGLAIIVLLVFIFIISRQWRYLIIITISLTINLAIAVIFFYWLNIDFHLYSLAGITISLGIIIDNTIVMVDHIYLYRNRKVFMAILASTFTTIGALSIIFYLKEQQRVNLVDFALVMLINLIVSLFVALFFIPAFLDKFPLNRSILGYQRKRLEFVVLLTNFYQRFILFSYRRKWLFIIVIIWGVGIPIFLLPDRLGNEQQDKKEISVKQQWYNNIFGNSYFVQEVKPWLNHILGGSLYYFASYLEEYGDNKENLRTRLTVNVSMPDGADLRQMNKLFLDFENFLLNFEQIESFVSHINGIDHSTISINFKEEEERGHFPYYLKQMIETKAVEIGGADFGVYGVGRGFNNKLHDSYHNSSISISGYNYDELMKYAVFLKKELLKHQRIKEVYIRTGNQEYGKSHYEYVAQMNLYELARHSSSIDRFYQNLTSLNLFSEQTFHITYDNNIVPVLIKFVNNDSASLWYLRNQPLKCNDEKYLRFKNVADYKKERISKSINKFNQQYQLFITYDFVGSQQLSERYLKRNIKMINNYLPLGYLAETGASKFIWNYKEKSQYKFLFLVVIIIYIICAILLESLLQPLAIIATIPISFIGVFLSFGYFKIPLDQGGYAAMILLCGLSVNSALYIINDYNIYRRQRLKNNPVKYYLKAYNHKIIPVLLTILSSIIGLLPFLFESSKEGFWFSLAVGSISGLLFNLLAIIICLPLFILLKNK